LPALRTKCAGRLDCCRSSLCLAYLRRQAKKAAKEGWKNSWFAEEEREIQGLKAKGLGKHYRLVVRDLISFNLKPTIPPLLRPNLSAYVQLKTGIGSMASYLAVIKKVDSEECGYCGAKQTPTHLILQCKRYSKQRSIMQKSLKKSAFNLQVLFCTTKGRKLLADYLCNTDICTKRWSLERSTGLYA
jgi:hypothetical protein